MQSLCKSFRDKINKFLQITLFINDIIYIYYQFAALAGTRKIILSTININQDINLSDRSLKIKVCVKCHYIVNLSI